MWGCLAQSAELLVSLGRVKDPEPRAGQRLEAGVVLCVVPTGELDRGASTLYCVAAAAAGA